MRLTVKMENGAGWMHAWTSGNEQFEDVCGGQVEGCVDVLVGMGNLIVCWSIPENYYYY